MQGHLRYTNPNTFVDAHPPPPAARNTSVSSHLIWPAIYLLLHISVMVRVLAVEGKEPASRAAWVIVLIFVPAVGILAYLLFGEPWVTFRSRRFANDTTTTLLPHLADAPTAGDQLPPQFRPVFDICQQLAGCPPVAGNTAELAADSKAAIDGMVRDFDAAQHSIHVSFYIWLTDASGLNVVAALQRAARRGVTCRVIADGVGSRRLIRSPHWAAMRDAGIRLCISMKIWRGLVWAGNRVDLRNHRKIVVVDNHVTWCGSQNCADAEFRVKPKFAPWVDIMLRLEGPVARQNQLLFAADWLAEAGESLHELLAAPVPEQAADGFTAIAFGTGPTSEPGAMSSVFVGLLYAATREAVISNPYFVPDQQLLAALVACARRGVDTTLILPALNDSLLVSAISKAHYRLLVRAGVRLFEFHAGLLHAKTLVVDGMVALVGSANMDRRSLDLNYENNVMLHDVSLVQQIRQRQDAWLAQSDLIAPATVLGRPLLRRLADNAATVVGPLM